MVSLVKQAANFASTIANNTKDVVKKGISIINNNPTTRSAIQIAIAATALYFIGAFDLTTCTPGYFSWMKPDCKPTLLGQVVKNIRPDYTNKLAYILTIGSGMGIIYVTIAKLRNFVNGYIQRRQQRPLMRAINFNLMHRSFPLNYNRINNSQATERDT